MNNSSEQIPVEPPDDSRRSSSDADFYVQMAKKAWLWPLMGFGFAASSVFSVWYSFQKSSLLTVIAIGALFWLFGCFVTIWLSFNLSRHRAMLQDIRKRIVTLIWVAIALVVMVFAVL
ncbi:hypothetical protein C5Y96_20955 [Blastopirellula marina]|uniref:Uncharacterized protein n=1 Tax=Blastopirellula marina TaxID=124 RepID=A0A2S8F183_9BACT|nr:MULTISPECIES: hypothetical protein [Pirellulaceae]PQO25926.1 hypothetical protein C5Y96_20955 [Blastopirellula marina]RCS44284.1 hypothetical protein DTL36_21000 [Bremerella cremea]